VDDFFRKGFEREEATPPSAGWAQMESLLDAQRQGDKPKKRPVFWYWAAAASLIPLFILGWGWLNTQEQSPALVIEKPQVRIDKGLQTNVNESKPDLIQNTERDKVQKEKRSFVSTGSNPILEKHPHKPATRTNTFVQKEGAEGIAFNPTSEEISIPKADLHTILIPMKDSVVKASSETKMVAQKVTENRGEETETARVEFRRASAPAEESEVATIEWKRGPKPKPTLNESLEKLQTAGLNSLEETKNNVVAWLGIKP
jgi:hypothetical protein